MQKEVVIYTDGACSGNPGVGGWAAILSYKGKEKEISGMVENTTNNRMEITAVIEGLSALKEPCTVEVYSDSAYVVDAINKGWIATWQKNGWRGADKKEIKNIGFWKDLIGLMEKHTVHFHKVKGHADDVLNNRCDELAQKARAALKE